MTSCTVDVRYSPIQYTEMYEEAFRIVSDISFNTFNDGRGGEIRTPDPLVPNQMRYQAALRPEQNDLYFRNDQKQALLSIFRN